MATLDDHKAMIRAVATAMGDSLRADVAFVGGCTTALLLTDLYHHAEPDDDGRPVDDCSHLLIGEWIRPIASATLPILLIRKPNQ